MKISRENIIYVDNYLKNKGVIFDDLRLELVDHIASEIEELVNDKEIKFDEAFEIIIPKWKSMLIPTTSHLLGIMHSFPKIMIDKLNFKVKKNVYYMFSIFTIWIICFLFFKMQLEEFLNPYSHIIKFSTVFVILSILLVMFLTNYKTKIKTTYRFLINHSSTNLTFFCIFYLFMNNSKSSPLLAYLILLIFQLLFVLKNYFSHKKLMLNLQKGT